MSTNEPKKSPVTGGVTRMEKIDKGVKPQPERVEKPTPPPPPPPAKKE